METRDNADLVATFRAKFMEGMAGIADRTAGVCAGLVEGPGGMAPHDMKMELAGSSAESWTVCLPLRSRTPSVPPALPRGELPAQSWGF